MPAPEKDVCRLMEASPARWCLPRAGYVIGTSSRPTSSVQGRLADHRPRTSGRDDPSAREDLIMGTVSTCPRAGRRDNAHRPPQRLLLRMTVLHLIPATRLSDRPEVILRTVTDDPVSTGGQRASPGRDLHRPQDDRERRHAYQTRTSFRRHPRMDEDRRRPVRLDATWCRAAVLEIETQAPSGARAGESARMAEASCARSAGLSRARPGRRSVFYEATRTTTCTCCGREVEILRGTAAGAQQRARFLLGNGRLLATRSGTIRAAPVQPDRPDRGAYLQLPSKSRLASPRRASSANACRARTSAGDRCRAGRLEKHVRRSRRSHVRLQRRPVQTHPDAASRMLRVGPDIERLRREKVPFVEWTGAGACCGWRQVRGADDHHVMSSLCGAPRARSSAAASPPRAYLRSILSLSAAPIEPRLLDG